MSVQSSSFDDLTDLESVKSGVSSTFEDVGIAFVVMNRKIAELEAKNQKLVEEMEKMKLEAKDSTEEESIMTAINGTWKIVSSNGMEEYIQRSKSSAIDTAFLEVGSKHFHFDQETKTLKSFTTLGTQKSTVLESKLGEEVTWDEMKLGLFVKNNALITPVLRDDGEEFMRFEKFVKNGQLHVVMNRFGFSCTRIYEKIGTNSQPGTKTPNDQVLNDLRRRISELEEEKRMEVEELKGKIATLELDRMKEELEKKTEERKCDTVTATPNIKNDFLGHWELQNPSSDYKSIPTKVLFSLEGGKLVERNNGSKKKKYICGNADAEYTWINTVGTRTFYCSEQGKLITESIFEDGSFSYYLKRWTEKDVLKVTTITYEGKRLEFIYKKIEL